MRTRSAPPHLLLRTGIKRYRLNDTASGLRSRKRNRFEAVFIITHNYQVLLSVIIVGGGTVLTSLRADFTQPDKVQPVQGIHSPFPSRYLAELCLHLHLITRDHNCKRTYGTRCTGYRRARIGSTGVRVPPPPLPPFFPPIKLVPLSPAKNLLSILLECLTLPCYTPEGMCRPWRVRVWIPPEAAS